MGERFCARVGDGHRMSGASHDLQRCREISGAAIEDEFLVLRSRIGWHKRGDLQIGSVRFTRGEVMTARAVEGKRACEGAFFAGRQKKAPSQARFPSTARA